MIRIETSMVGNRVIFAMIGRIQSSDLPGLKRLIESDKAAVILDLKQVSLVDRAVVEFFANFERANGQITNCPNYIREWICREGAER
jgi:Fe-S cluster assembly iron-binding protein IscA